MNSLWRRHQNYGVIIKPKAQSPVCTVCVCLHSHHQPDDRCVGDRLDTQHPPIIFPVLLEYSVPTISHPLMLHDIVFTLILFSRHLRRNSLQNDRFRLMLAVGRGRVMTGLMVKYLQLTCVYTYAPIPYKVT